jgi:rare lipoprotein A
MVKTRAGQARRVLGATTVAMLMAIPLSGTAGAHPLQRFWTYGKDVRVHTWDKHPELRRLHRRWHRNHPDATWRKHKNFHHHRLEHRVRKRYAHDVVASQWGKASYYSGRVGACGVPLTGLYAAHRDWPCGSKVSVRRGNRYVIVKVLDRGPFVGGRVIDISREAFSQLAPLSAGVTDVSIHRHKKRSR